VDDDNATRRLEAALREIAAVQAAFDPPPDLSAYRRAVLEGLDRRDRRRRDAAFLALMERRRRLRKQSNDSPDPVPDPQEQYSDAS